MRPVGHTPVVAALERNLPPVVLLRGPHSIGKATIVEHLAEYHRVHRSEFLRCLAPLGVDTVRAAIMFASTFSDGPFKLIFVELDDASGTAVNALLKTLEEPPPTARFILTTSQAVSPTVSSRAAVYPMGLLNRVELRTILMRHGLTEDAADYGAALGRGQVSAAMAIAADEHNNTAAAMVRTIMRAIATRDHDLFDRAARAVDEPARQLLIRLLTEAITDQWRLFTPADTCGLVDNQPQLRRMLVALNQLPAARARLSVHVALQPIVANP